MKMFFLLLLLSFPVFAQNGRYQVVFHPQFRSDSVMIDTHTGKMWKDTCFKQGDSATQCKVSAWAPETVIGVNAKYEDVGKAIKDLEAEEKNK